MVLLFVSAGAALLFALFIIASHNRAVGLEHRLSNARHQIEVQLARRHDLIPNLVSVVRGAMQHERHLVETVVRARAEAVAALVQGVGSEDSKIAESALTAALRPVLSFVESNPSVTVYGNIMGLQEELSSTENRIAFARQAYNDEVMRFNYGLKQFPMSYFLRDAKPAQPWVMPEGSGEIVKVDLRSSAEQVAV